MKIESRITSADVQEFLKDVKDRSETVILEEGAQKNELLESARKRGIIISKNDRDLGVIKSIYCFTTKPNSNKTRVPQNEFVKIFPQIVGRPMNYAHNRQMILGFYIDYKYIQKEDKAITYSIFFKSAYPKLWKKAKDFQKKKKLSSSYEIWNDERKTEFLSDGTHFLHQLGMAGGALIFEEYGEVPAFRGAKVLSLASKEVTESVDGKCLAYASKYNPKEIITADKDYFKDSVDENLKKLQEEKKVEEVKKEAPKVDVKEEEPKAEEKKEVKVEDKKVEEKPKAEEKIVEPTIPKIKCSNCSHEWEIATQPEFRLLTEKCPKCFAILKQDGTMIHPPQIIDFKVSCPSCRMGSWLLLAKDDKEAKVKCLGCSKEFVASFAEEKPNELIEKIHFTHAGSVNCYQCGKLIEYEGVSGVTSRTLKCSRCNLEFDFDITKAERYKKISKIKEIEIKKIEKSSEKGGQVMAEEKKVSENKIEVSKYHRSVDDFETLEKSLGDVDGLEEAAKAARLTNEQRKALPDNMFAVVVRVKDKRTGKLRKIRKYPINDEAHVRNALARLGQPAAQETLRELGVSVESVRRKVLKRAATLNMTSLLERYKKSSKGKEKASEPKVEKTPKAKETPKAEEKVEPAKEAKSVQVNTEPTAPIVTDNADTTIPEKAKEAVVETTKGKVEEPKEDLSKAKLDELVSQIASLKKEVTKMKVESAEKVDFYKANAVEINKRREELGDFGNDLTDEQILNEDKFEKAKLEKEIEALKNANLEKSSEVVGLKKKDGGYYDKLNKEIDDVAFPKNKKKKDI